MSQNLGFRTLQTKSVPVTINAPLGDVITPVNCSKLVSEIIKYVLYRKQQIPYPFEYLRDVATSSKPQSPARGTQNQRKIFVSEGRQNKQAVKAYETLDMMFKNLDSELHSCGSDGLKEVVLLLGSTPVSPQEIYRIVLPSLAVHSGAVGVGLRPCLLQIIRHFTSSSELNDVLDRTLTTTNTYVFLKKEKSYDAAAWFLPKDRYILPKRGRHVIISLTQLLPNLASSNVSLYITNYFPPPSLSKFTVHQDDDISINQTPIVPKLPGVLKDSIIADCSVSNVTNGNIQWFQSRSFLRGFAN